MPVVAAVIGRLVADDPMASGGGFEAGLAGVLGGGFAYY